MHQVYLFIVTAILEVGTGVALLIVPTIPLTLLLGVEHSAQETLLVGRIAGAALLAIGVACWLTRGDTCTPAPLGLLIGVLIYDAAAAAILAYAGLVLSMVGMALWPAVVIHAALAVWCLLSIPLHPLNN